jgi:MFS family permease
LSNGAIRSPAAGTVTPIGPKTQEAAAGARGLGRPYAKLWTASTTSAIGDGMSLTAAPLLASKLTTDPRLIAAVTVALTLPYVLFGIPAGVLADRLDLRRSMARIDWVRGLILGSLALGVALGWRNLPVLYLCLFLVGTGETYFRNASQILVPQVAPAGRLVTANSWLQAAQITGNQFAGPLLGAALFAVSVALPFGIDSLTFLVSAALLTALRIPPRTQPAAATLPGEKQPGEKRPRMRADMLVGARWLSRHRLLRSLSMIAAVINCVVTGVLAVLVVHAHSVLRLSDFGYGVLLACQAAGAVFAAKVSPLLTRRLGGERSLVCVALAIATGYAAIWLSHSAWVAGTALAVVACADVTWNVVVVVLRQTLIPRQLQGRVNSVYRLVAWGAMPLGAAASGLLARAAGTSAVFGSGAIVMVVVAVPLAFGARAHWFDGVEVDR